MICSWLSFGGLDFALAHVNGGHARSNSVCYSAFILLTSQTILVYLLFYPQKG